MAHAATLRVMLSTAVFLSVGREEDEPEQRMTGLRMCGWRLARRAGMTRGREPNRCQQYLEPIYAERELGGRDGRHTFCL